jgi:hypothetical protein
VPTSEAALAVISGKFAQAQEYYSTFASSTGALSMAAQDLGSSAEPVSISRRRQYRSAGYDLGADHVHYRYAGGQVSRGFCVTKDQMGQLDPSRTETKVLENVGKFISNSAAPEGSASGSAAADSMTVSAKDYTGDNKVTIDDVYAAVNTELSPKWEAFRTAAKALV